jgi:5-methylthioadenosine/S-adenosylhomocysteine deaminase
MQTVDQIISPSWIFDGVSNDLLENKSIVIKGNKIIDIVPTNQLQDLYQADAVFNLDNHLLTPGLINAHTHASMSLLKGYADDCSLNDWLHHFIWPAEKKYVDESFVRDGTRLAIAEMIKSGITSFNDMYFYPEVTAEVCVEHGMRGNLGLVTLDFATNYAHDPDDYLNKGLHFRDQFRGESLITTSLAPHAPYSVSDKTFEKINTYAVELDLRIHTHLHETRHEITESEEKYGASPIQRLDKLGILGPAVTAAHCVHLSSLDLEILNKNNVTVVYNPTSNLKLGSGIADLKSMMNKKLCIAVGTDGSASNNRLDVLNELLIGLLVNKGVNMESEFLNAKVAFQMATLNGAKALGIEDKVGTIEKNKLADMTTFDLSNLYCQPSYDPLASLIYSGGRSLVSHVWIDGNLKLKEGELQSFDESSLLTKAKTWQDKIKTILTN